MLAVNPIEQEFRQSHDCAAKPQYAAEIVFTAIPDFYTATRLRPSYALATRNATFQLRGGTERVSLLKTACPA